MQQINIFVGPKKTGTSWISKNAQNIHYYDKEILFPKRYFKNFIYNKYIKNSSILVWPYLLHETERLESMLCFLENKGIQPNIYITLRDKKEWRKSLKNFYCKYGFDAENANKKVKLEEKNIIKSLRFLNQGRSYNFIKVINADNQDLEILSELISVPASLLISSRNIKVYKTNEENRLHPRGLSRLFFIIKPYLPKFLRRVTKVRLLRKVFFKQKA